MNEKTTMTIGEWMGPGGIYYGPGGIYYDPLGTDRFFLRSNEMLILVPEPKHTGQNHRKELAGILGDTLHGGPSTRLLDEVRVYPVTGTSGSALTSDDPRLWLLVMWLLGFYSAGETDKELWYSHNLGRQVRQAVMGSTVELAIGAPVDVPDAVRHELKEAGEHMATAA